MESMKSNGWQGDPISVFEEDGTKYILDGHHRVQAALRVGIDVPYEIVAVEDLPQFGYKTVDELISASAEAGPVKLYIKQ